MTLLAGEPARTLALAACLESLGADLHRAELPLPGRATGVAAGVADAHGAAARAATVALGRLADRLLDDADLLYLVTARYRRADEQAADEIGAIRSPGAAGWSDGIGRDPSAGSAALPTTRGPGVAGSTP
jgi:hypothetical protein